MIGVMKKTKVVDDPLLTLEEASEAFWISQAELYRRSRLSPIHEDYLPSCRVKGNVFFREHATMRRLYGRK